MTEDIALSYRKALWSAAVHCSIAQPTCRSKMPTHPFVWEAHCFLRCSTRSEDVPARPESVDDHASAAIEAAHLPAADNTRTETAPCSTLRTGSRRTMRRDAGRLATANRRRAYSPCGCCIRRPPGAETPSMRTNIRHKKPPLDGGGTAVCGVATLRGGVCYRRMRAVKLQAQTLRALSVSNAMPQECKSRCMDSGSPRSGGKLNTSVNA